MIKRKSFPRKRAKSARYKALKARYKDYAERHGWSPKSDEYKRYVWGGLRNHYMRKR